MKIREERSSDQPAIRALVTDAFGQAQEANLVDALRTTGDLKVSLVAEEDGKLCGHVALSRLTSPARALALAPVSVLTQEQGRGVGSRLIRDAIEQARQLGYEIVFVLGDPEYYSRFGFSPETAVPFPCPYAGPYFMALWLTDERRAPDTVVYASAFGDLE